jgi:hypothetical protein
VEENVLSAVNFTSHITCIEDSVDTSYGPHCLEGSSGSWLFDWMNSSKVSAIAQELLEARDSKSLVFSSFKAIASLVATALRDSGISGIVNGEIPVKARKNLLRQSNSGRPRSILHLWLWL